MTTAGKSKYYEMAVYTLVWTVVMLFPIVSAVFSAGGSASVKWAGVFRTWAAIIPFLLLFVAHNILMQKLFLVDKTKIYVASVILLLALFGSWQYHMTDWEFTPEHADLPAGPPRFDSPPDFWDGKPEDGKRKMMLPGQMTPGKGPYRPGPGRIPFPFIMNMIIAMLMLSFNMAIALLFRYEREVTCRRELENTSLQHELEYLKAQLNPHFFMNMLNNIHGMVDVNPALAQEMILDLSKLMRYVLYDGAAAKTSFVREIEFIDNYISLMRQRFSGSRVHIEAHLPDNPPGDLMIPPLLTVVFLENAFKHGISYRKTSFVEIRLSVEEYGIKFICRNSNVHSDEQEHQHGVGLANVRKRLDLLFGDRYSLDIDNKPDIFSVTLIFPKS